MTEVKQVELVDNYQEVRDNIMQFSRDLEKDPYLRKFLSLYRNWYYLPQLDMFGPGMFIGYKNMNSDRYGLLQRAGRELQVTGRILDSRKVGRVLCRWFKAVEEEEYRWELYRRLVAFLKVNGKTPNKRCKIFLPG